MAGEIDDEGFLQSFFFSVLPVWEKQQEEITRLLQSFENEMSPRVLLRQSETKSWLAELVHQLWLSRYPVEQWVLNALSKVGHAQAAYDIIKKSLSQTDDICNVIQNEDFRKQFIEFRYYCQQTAKAIESFPSKVAVL
jgi:3-dehydroquinate dehydratase